MVDIEVEIAQGVLRGRTENGVSAFLGIPYAQAPFGVNRFRAPTEPPSWEGVRPAVAHGATAPSPGYAPPINAILVGARVEGQDCLNLCVWSPDVSGSAPVAVWIHGGAFVNGSNAIATYDGSSFARSGVVLVAMNYRLGVEGFARIEGAPANRGLLDQVAALRWVRENIAAFGGDANSVTIFGESAGAMSVGTLLSMPSAQGLFHRAILQSGAGHHVISEDAAAQVAAAVGSHLGVEATIDALSQADPERVIQAQVAVGLAATADPATYPEIALNMMPFEPYIDGEVVPERPYDRIAAGSASGVDVLVGSNVDEHALFIVPAGLDQYVDENFLRRTFEAYGANVDTALTTYRQVHPGASPGELLIAVMSDWFFRIPALRIAEAVDGHVYEFGYRSTLFDGRLASCHALEIPFVFDNVHHSDSERITGPGAPRELATEVHRSWVQFISTGDPGWARYGDTRTVRAFPGQLVTDPRGSTRQVWDGVR